MSGFPPRVHRYVVAVAVLAALAFSVALVEVGRSPGADATLALLGGAAFVAGFLVLERNAVSFAWREHRISTSLTEVAVYVGFVALPPAFLVFLVPVALTWIHLATKRPPIKGVFNIAHGAVAAALAAGVVLLALGLGAPPVFAALPGAVVFSLASDGLVAGLFGALEGVSPLRAYRERFLLSNALALAVGVPAGLALVGLHALHPFALVAAAPIVLLMHRHTQLQARADRELVVRRRLAADAHALVGAADEEAIAARVLDATRELLDASRARLRLRDGAAWMDEGDDALPLASRAPLVVNVQGRDGETYGTLEAWERPAKARYAEEDRALLQIVAAQAAHGLESARALREAAAQRDLIARQEKLSALGTLMAGVAHEINNPLSYLRLRAESSRLDTDRALAGGSTDARAYAARMKRHLETMTRGIDRLGALSESLKSVARPGDGARRPTDLNHVVRQVLTVLQAGHREIVFEQDLAPDLPLVQANGGELQQVVLNLVKNAAEALQGQRDARIRVATSTDASGAVCIVVEDDGPGIPEDARERLFSPFFTTKEGGTGLGLSISRQIVVAHGGELSAGSGALGGAAFTLRLPLAAPSAGRPETQAQS